ncbi:unnamed protein product, partial [Symbiodinium microadriaticum]
AWTNRGMRAQWPGDRAGAAPGQSSRAPRREARDLFPRYLNSGMIMGRMGQIRSMYREVMEASVAYMYIDDQHLLTNYANRHPALISLDYGSELFFNTYGLAPDDVSFSQHFAVVWRNGHLRDVATLGTAVVDRVLCSSAVHGSGGSGKDVYK